MKFSIIICLSIFANAAFAAPQPNLENHFSKGVHSLCVSTVTLLSGSPVLCELNESFESDQATIGQMLNFKVVADVRVNNQVVIRTGALATGRVKALTKATYNEPATVTLELTGVQTADGQMIKLHSDDQKLKGEYRGQGMTVHIGTKSMGYVTNQTEIRVN